MSHIRRSSDPKLHKREVTIHLHNTSFSPSHGLREDLCCGGSRRINPGLDSNTFVSGMTTIFCLTVLFCVKELLESMIETRKLLKECGYDKAIINSKSNKMSLISSNGTIFEIADDDDDVYDYDDDNNNAGEDEDYSYCYNFSDQEKEEGEEVQHKIEWANKYNKPFTHSITGYE